MNDNVIINTDGDMIGFYNDLVQYLKNELLRLLQEEKSAPDSGALANYSEIFEQLEKQKDAAGLLVISENNGMGWTAEKYREEETATDKDYKKLAEGVQALNKLHHESPEDIAKYIKQYAKIR